MRNPRLLLALLLPLAPTAAPAGTQEDLQTLRAADGVKATPLATQEAWSRLASSSPAEIPKLLVAMQDADPTAQNMLRAAVDAIAERAAPDAMPLDALQAFLGDANQAPRARRTAFEWIVRIEPSQKESLLSAMLDDPDLELRYDAVAQLISRAEKLEEKSEAQLGLYRKALVASRNSDQLKKIQAALAERGETTDLVQVMGFFKSWRVVGPFDNADQQHFDTAYPPESKIDLAAEYEGTEGAASWQTLAGRDKDGVVDLRGLYGRKPDAIAYAFTTFESGEDREAQLRYSSKNATKVWLNGTLVASNEVYHSGSSVDQYRADVQLRKGENRLLIKLCQNAMKMSWENEWEFQLRVVDKLGTPVGFQSAATEPTSTTSD